MHAWIAGVARHFLIAWCMVAPLACSGQAVQQAGAVKPPERPPCDRAADLRARVPRLLAEGKLWRTANVIEKADRLCPATMGRTWAAKLEVLAELGRHAEARALQVIGAAPDAPKVAKQAAQMAEEQAARFGDSVPSEADVPPEKLASYWSAAEAEAKGALREALGLYQKAWEDWPLNGMALIRAGLVAKQLGDKALAQRLFDRGIEALERRTGKAVVSEVPDSFAPIGDLAWSPDGKRIAIASLNAVRIVATDERLPLLGHMDSVNSVAFSPDGTWLVSGSDDASVRLWDGTTSRPIRILAGHVAEVWAVAFSPDGKLIASGSKDKAVRVWDAATGSSVHTLRGHTAGVASVVFSPDGSQIASGSRDHAVRLWDAATASPVRTLQGHTDEVAEVAFSPDGKLIASASKDKTVRVWDAATGSPVRTLEGHAGMVVSVVFSPHGRQIASGALDGTVRVWNAATGTVVRELPGHKGKVAVVFSPDGKHIASGEVQNGSVGLWDATTGKAIRTVRGTAALYTLAFSPTGKMLAAGSNRGVWLWDGRDTATSSGVLLEGGPSSSLSLAFSPDGTTIASAGLDGPVRLWKITVGSLYERRTLQVQDAATLSLAFSPDGELIATGSFDNAVRVWNPAVNHTLQTLEGHTGYVWAVAFSPNSELIASAGDNTVRLWDVTTGRVIGWDATRDRPIRKGIAIRTLQGHTESVYTVAFSPDGELIASGSSDKTVRLWDTATGRAVRTLRGHTEPVYAVAFSPSGRTIASGASDGTIRFWTTATGEHVHTLPHPAGVRDLAFSSDGNLFAVTEYSGGSILIGSFPMMTPLATLRVVASQDAGYVFTPAGHIDFDGVKRCSARALAVCRIGSQSLPFDACEERLYTPDLLTKIFTGDRAYLDPESRNPPLNCPIAALPDAPP